MDKVKDMTKGSPVGLIFTFAIPLMLGNLFQQLYTVADSLIVSRGVSVDAGDYAGLRYSDRAAFRSGRPAGP